MNRIALIGIVLIALTGCAGKGNTASPDVPSSQITPATTPVPSSTPTKVENVTFKDYALQSWSLPLRELNHSDADASYILYEYEVTKPLTEVDDWLRSESIRLGGKVIERYSFNITSNANLDLIIELPSETGTRIISTYTTKYVDKQHLVIEETLFKNSTSIDQNYEDHALIIFTTLEDGSTKESFKGSYPHQHTDIYSIHFYSLAFFEELFKVDRYNLIKQSELNYFAGYSDKEGKEVFYESVTEENSDQFTFGIQLQEDFLPKDEIQRDRLLRSWAKTLLLGDKAYSRIIEGQEQINFVLQGKILKSFTARELISDTSV
ncbi:hypothetical protein [Cohnella abietis]|uniref:Uncharacterized protein n=1 Tax=Cohnella abietis TaxID=2507935 RepID=A0A3T1D2K5_9BACL|nr:hypothetical protein [Cohnella abietis]BBI32259.1 hypothetical protein KCTCHS21_16580 [Cohnella abietis]